MNTPTDAVASALGYWKSPQGEFGLGGGACRVQVRKGKGWGPVVVVLVMVMHLPFPGVISNIGHV